MSVAREMPRYKSHKTVWALKILMIDPLPNPDPGNSAAMSYGAKITPAEEGYAPFDVDADYVTRRRPEAGGYFVVYEDGYQSFSPAKAFEEGYLSLDEMERIAPAPKNLREALADALNRFCAENGSNSPDFILAEYVASSLIAFDNAVNARERWHGRKVELLDTADDAPRVEGAEANSPVPPLEQAIVAAGADKAPRIKAEQVDAEIVGETYTLLPSGRVTVCELTMQNGFTVRGESAVVFIENFDSSIGRRVARENARDQIWQLLGYQLRELEHQAATAPRPA